MPQDLRRESSHHVQTPNALVIITSLFVNYQYQKQGTYRIFDDRVFINQAIDVCSGLRPFRHHILALLQQGPQFVLIFSTLWKSK